MTDITSIDFTQILDSAKEYNDVADDMRRVQANVDNIDPTDAFGDDEYGHKVIPNILAVQQASHSLLSGTHDMVGGAARNLGIVVQSFGNANDVNEGIVKAVNR